MAVKIFQVSEHKDEIMKLLRDGATPEDLAAKFPVSLRSIQRYLKEVKDEKAGKIPEGAAGAGSGQKVVKSAQELAVVTSKLPGPIVFRMGDQTIDLNPANLYDAYRYCEDIKRIDPSIDDDFTTMVKTACKHVWEVFSEREARRVGASVELAKEGQ